MHLRTKAAGALSALTLAMAISGIAHAQKRMGATAPTGGAADDAPAQASPLDPNFYFDRYPDLKVLGRDRAALQKHWDMHGRGELRAPSRAGDPTVQSADAWRAGCVRGQWGPVRRGKGNNLVPVCEHINYQFALAYHVMLEAPRSGNGRDHLRAGDYLRQGEYLVSANKRFFAALQPDGNFCTYDGSSPASPHGGAKWCSMTRPAGAGPFFAIQQSDGNFCVYRGTRPGDSKGGVYCVFTASQGTTQPYYYAVLQDDANFAINRGSGPSNKWSHVWDRVTSTPPKPDTGLEAFWKDLKEIKASMDKFERDRAAGDAAVRANLPGAR